MLLREDDTGHLRSWLLPKLENVSEADVDVLADYVVALVAANDSEAGLKDHCVESLQDFLHENTAGFVDELAKVVRTRSYLPRAQAKSQSTNEPQQDDASSPGPNSSIRRTFTAANAPDPSHAAKSSSSRIPTGPAALLPAQQSSASTSAKQSSRKRKQEKRQGSETRDGEDPHYNPSSIGRRPLKQLNRGGANSALRATAATFQPRSVVPDFKPMPNMFSPANLLAPPLPPPFGMPSAPGPLFPNFALPATPDALPAGFAFPPPPNIIPDEIMAYQFQMMANASVEGNMPGMPSFAKLHSQSNQTDGRTHKIKCVNYHEKGFCFWGPVCEFQHDDPSATSDVPEYDPEEPSLGTPFGTNTKRFKSSKTRAPFLAPNDPTNTTLAVKHIPKEYCNEEDVRRFFSEFGTIIDIKLQSYKRTAIIKFGDHAAAKQAYISPRAVFGNRFVKVHWYKDSSTTAAPCDGAGLVKDVIPLDLAEVAKRQSEAQKAFEERRRKREEAEAKSADIDRQIKDKDAQMKKIRQQLAELVGEDAGEDGERSRDLATLAAEAETLFALKEPPLNGEHRGGYPPRGAYRGRGMAHRGGFFGRGRGRGTFSPFVKNRSSVKRLDNRPRRVAVAEMPNGSRQEEALREYLLKLPGCTNIEEHQEQPNTLIVTFEQRYQAETFIANCQVPDVGPLKLSWIPNHAFGGASANTTTQKTEADDDANADTGLEGNASDDDSSDTAEGGEVEADENHSPADLDMDVAEDAEQWL